jgi:hydroxypyruvate reductase
MLCCSPPSGGEARDVARSSPYRQRGAPLGRARPAAGLHRGGGETTVTIREAAGGRNQEMALAAAISIAGRQDLTIACLATDGTDGPTDASGALADGSTVARARAWGWTPWTTWG